MEKRKTFLVWMLILVMIVLVSVTGCMSKEEQREPAHSEETPGAGNNRENEKDAVDTAFREEILYMMANRIDPASITGNKAIAAVYEDKHVMRATICNDYVPEAYRAEDPSQVRYIIKVVKGQDMAGTYSNGGGFAWKHHFYLTLIDLKEEAVLHFEEIFGGNPPEAVTGDEGFSHYGSEPTAESIQVWAEEHIQSGVTEESERLWLTIHVKIPESWAAPYCIAEDDGLGVFGENDYDTGRTHRKMDKDGEWYVVDIPNWTETVCFSSDPELPDVKFSEEEKNYGDDDIWLIVSEIDGSVKKDYDAAKEND